VSQLEPEPTGQEKNQRKLLEAHQQQASSISRWRPEVKPSFSMSRQNHFP
jgi:hypothetical protein